MGKNAYQIELEQQGYALVPEQIAPDVLDRILADVGRLTEATSTRRGQRYATRNLLQNAPAVAELARSTPVLALVHPILGPAAFPVRALLFDKVPGANWHVGWHQDQIIPVQERKDVPGYSGWSVKRGVPHVRPPAEVLEKMLTLRMHLDDCGRDNGALRIIPGTHRAGFIDDDEIMRIVDSSTAVVCEARRGAVLAMRPLALHSSSPATSPSHRRVLHLEFAAEPLPGGLEWPIYETAAASV